MNRLNQMIMTSFSLRMSLYILVASAAVFILGSGALARQCRSFPPGEAAGAPAPEQRIAAQGHISPRDCARLSLQASNRRSRLLASRRNGDILWAGCSNDSG